MKKATIGIIGAGRIGRLHAENLRANPRVKIKAISDLYAQAVAEWAAGLGIPRVTDDFGEILRDPDIDAVFICSSTHTHVPIILEAARAGKHIFCEKPISFDLSQTRQALEVAEAAGVKFQTGFNRRFDPHFRRVRELVLAGTIGEPHIVKITSRDPEPPAREYIQVSGGLFLDMAIHDFDMARYLIASEVEEVNVTAGVLVDPVFAECGDVDTAVTTLKFANGAIGVIDNSRRAVYGYDQRVEVFGSAGCVTVSNDYPNSAEVSTKDGVRRDNPKFFFLERYREAYIAETDAFIDSLLEDKPTPVDGDDGLMAELIAHAARKSLHEGRPVKLAEMEAELNAAEGR